MTNLVILFYQYDERDHIAHYSSEFAIRSSGKLKVKFSTFLQSEPPSPRSPSSPSGADFAIAANGMTSAAGLGTLGPEDASVTSGDFFEALTSSEFYKNTKVVLLTSKPEKLSSILNSFLFLAVCNILVNL